MKTIDAYVVLSDGKLDLQKVYTEECVAAKDARIAELESENSHLRHGMTGDYDLDAWLEWCAKKDATPSEDGLEVDDFASVLRDEIQRVFDYGRQNYRGCMNETIEQLQVQYSRIVAAKDAEIAYHKDRAEQLDREISAMISDAIDAQPARQVGGG